MEDSRQQRKSNRECSVSFQRFKRTAAISVQFTILQTNLDLKKRENDNKVNNLGGKQRKKQPSVSSSRTSQKL
jgi:hypothetical protein